MLLYCILVLYYNITGSPSYMRSVFDRNVVTRRIPVLRFFRVIITMPPVRSHLHHTIILIKGNTEQSLETCRHKAAFDLGEQ
jgi:hypothetical protein